VEIAASEVHRERVRAYYKKTAEDRKAYAKAWRKRRPDLVKIHYRAANGQAKAARRKAAHGT
jgi:hypothetical protein